MVAPLGGEVPATVPFYKLAIADISPRDKCPGDQASFLQMKLDDGPDKFLTLRVQGHLCSVSKGVHSVAFALILPTDIIDNAFIEGLPSQASLVASGLPSLKHIGAKVRVKITKLTVEDGRIPLRLEWLPDDIDGRIEHSPMSIWLKKKSDPSGGLPWQKLEFSELEQQILQPVGIAGLITSPKIKR
jgi:hypothetical protein